MIRSIPLSVLRLDPEHIDRLVKYHLEENVGITCNRHDNLVYADEIDGLDVEVFSFKSLEKAYTKAVDPLDREHVTRWMYNNLLSQVVACGVHVKNPAELKLSIDTQEDYERVCRIYESLGCNFNTKDLVRYFEREKTK
jgi:spore coat polysaccharide biosynthesis protein SpsF